MRKLSYWAAFTMLLAVASPAMAQQAVGFGGVNPAAIVNQPIVTGSSSSAGIPLFNHSIHLQDFMPHLTTFSNQSVIGQSTYPTPENMLGQNYLKAFGFSQTQALPPATPTKKKRIPTILLQRPDNTTNTSK
jgi:hypothetical protein